MKKLFLGSLAFAAMALTSCSEENEALLNNTFEVFTEPGAVLRDPESGRTMAVTTDCPGIHFYSGNYLNGAPGKGGVIYPRRSGMCLEAHYYPDAVHNPQWKQPVIKAGVPCIHRTKFQFSSY